MEYNYILITYCPSSYDSRRDYYDQSYIHQQCFESIYETVLAIAEFQVEHGRDAEFTVITPNDFKEGAWWEDCSQEIHDTLETVREDVRREKYEKEETERKRIEAERKAEYERKEKIRRREQYEELKKEFEKL